MKNNQKNNVRRLLAYLLIMDIYASEMVIPPFKTEEEFNFKVDYQEERLNNEPSLARRREKSYNSYKRNARNELK